MTVSIVATSPASLSPADRQAWIDLQQADRTFESPYFHPGWTEAVARHRDDVQVAVFRTGDGKPVGFWPFERQGQMAIAVGAPLNDYQGCVMQRGLEIDESELLDAAGVQRWHFDHLLASQPVSRDYVDTVTSSPFLDLTGGVDDYLPRIGKSGRRQIKSIRKKQEKMIERVGPVSFDPDSLDPNALDQLLEWKSAQYRETNLPDVFASEWTRDLLHDLLVNRNDAEAFCGKMAVLTVADRIAAVHFGLRAGPVIHWWFPTYDDDLAEHSPGWQLLVGMIDAAHDEGIDKIDLGKGMSQFKRQAMSGEVGLKEGLIEPSALRRTLRRTGLDLKERLKQTPLKAALQAPARWLFHRQFARTLEH